MRKTKPFLPALGLLCLLAAPLGAYAQITPFDYRSDLKERVIEGRIEFTEVPDIVRSNFHRLYFSTYVHHWTEIETEQGKVYMATFGEKAAPWKAVMSADGMLLTDMHVVNRTQIPEVVLTGIQKNLDDSDWRPLIYHQVNRSSIGADYAVLMMKDKTEAMTVFADRSGRVLWKNRIRE